MEVTIGRAAESGQTRDVEGKPPPSTGVPADGASTPPEREPVAHKTRILVLEGPARQAGDFLQHCQPDWELVRVQDPVQAAALLRAEPFDGFYTATRDGAAARPLTFLQAEVTLEALAARVAVLTPDLRVAWANVAFEKWCGGALLGRPFLEALGTPAVLGPDPEPLRTALTGKPTVARLQGPDKRHLELHVTPLFGHDGAVTQLVCLGRDVTAEVQKQQKLDALHQAGRELAELPAEQLADMSVEERIDVLKRNIRRFTRDVLHYDVIEVRLLDSNTGKLEPLLQEGMTPSASRRELFARPDGYGVTGYVAATGKSYLCPETAADRRYLEGAQGARSSLTVPLVYHDKVIGTLNVENPEPNAFGEDDRQYAELFSREIAAAVHTLDLLNAEKRSAASQSVEAVSRAIAMPVDEILHAATAVLERYLGHDAEITAKLKQILESARAVKRSVQKVGDDLAPATAACRPEAAAHPRLRGLRVLVADDDDRIRRSAHAILGRLGCVVETARDGHEALTMAKLSDYDVILTDIRLPDVSGYEVFCQLRKTRPSARVVLMTAYGYDPSHAIVKARQEGLGHVLYKPFRVDQLLAALEGSSAAAPARGT